MLKKSKTPVIFLISFILNAIWELLHYPLYVDLSGIPHYPHLFLATTADAAIITAIFLVVSLINSNTSWTKNPKPKDYTIIIILTLAIAITIETINLNLSRWQYTSLMPTIFSIGLSPLFQLAVTSILTLIILKTRNLKRHKNL